MSRKNKIIKNCVIVFVAFLIFINYNGIYVTPLEAHEFSEKSIHYGPSEVKHIEDYNNRKYLLCQYDKLVSCDVVKRSLVFFWSIGGSPIGFVNDTKEAVDYACSGSDNIAKLHGIINDPSIIKIEAVFKSGEVLTQTNFYDGLFLIIWEGQKFPDKVNGYDVNGNIIFTGK